MLHYRAPKGPAEILLTEGFPHVPLVSEVWVRRVPAAYGKRRLKVWLVFTLLESDARKHADQVQVEFEQRLRGSEEASLEFMVEHRTPHERPVIEGGACIWVRGT